MIVMTRAADIIEDMAALDQAWSAPRALEQADREFKNQGDHGQIKFTVTAVINSIKRHIAAATGNRDFPQVSD